MELPTPNSKNETMKIIDGMEDTLPTEQSSSFLYSLLQTKAWDSSVQEHKQLITHHKVLNNV
jgi:hypothetical protein